jgi:NADP-dependent 3-hydroxy acid dehydrogenase YdfG
MIITGASSGFGAEAARLFTKEGCKVVLCARRLDRLEELAAQIRAMGGAREKKSRRCLDWPSRKTTRSTDDPCGPRKFDDLQLSLLFRLTKIA